MMLSFPSSAVAEQYIRRHPELINTAAFSWYKSGSWGIAVSSKSGAFQFVSRDANGVFRVGDKILEDGYTHFGGTMQPNLQIHVEALIGKPAEVRLAERRHRISYNKTKAPRFSSANQPGRKRASP